MPKCDKKPSCEIKDTPFADYDMPRVAAPHMTAVLHIGMDVPKGVSQVRITPAIRNQLVRVLAPVMTQVFSDHQFSEQEMRETTARLQAIFKQGFVEEAAAAAAAAPAADPNPDAC